MAKQRSPILGYNHNIRYRGLVFHVQTEDSGVTNPHVFTHLFHGGVILTTRKLVYDADSSEESVKGLMQSQHKVVLRDLKRGHFDDKMDAYLGGTPGLLPRGQGVDGDAGGVDAAPVRASTAPPAEVPDPQPAELAAPPTTRATTQGTMPGMPSIPAPTRSGRFPAISDSLEARAPTERFTPELHGADPLPPPPDGSTAKGTDPAQRQEARRDISAAFQAIIVEDGAVVPLGGGLVEVDDDVIEIRSEAPGSAPLPPGSMTPMPIQVRAGSYAQHRRRGETGRISPDGEPMMPSDDASFSAPQGTSPGPAERKSHPPPPPPPPAPSARASTVPPLAPRSPAGGMPAVRPPAPIARPTPPAGMARPPSVAPPVATRPATVPPPGYAPTRPGGPGAPGQGRTGPQPRTRSPSGGGVVVTRPAVIIGAPARTIGAPAPSAPSPAPQQASSPAGRGSGKVRKAREESDSGMFGQDLISEKSLDEVILAYLSEDGTDD